MTVARNAGYDFDLLDIDVNDYTDEFVESFISSNSYDVFLFGCIVTHYKWAKWLTRTIKTHHPSSIVIVGNSVAGSIPEVFLRNSEADIAVIGEGEITTLELLNALSLGSDTREIEGIAYLDNDSFVQTPKRKACKVDDLPLTDWDLFDTQKYFQRIDYSMAEGLLVDPNSPPIIMPVVTARGCAFKCSFCHYVFWHDPYRFRSPENIVREIRRNIEKYDASYFNFWDDLSFGSLRQAERLADEILSSGLDFQWSCTIRADLFGDTRHSYEKRLSVAEKFKQAGCRATSFALESGDPDILEMMNKRIEPKYFEESVKLVREVGLVVSTTVVFGYPIETKATIKKTFEMCERNRLYPSIGYLMPLPGTGMYDYAKKNGYITDDDEYLSTLRERQDFGINMTSLTDADLIETIKREALKLNKALDLELNSDNLIKTGGYRSHTVETSENARLMTQAGNLFSSSDGQNPNDFSLKLNFARAKFDDRSPPTD